MREIRFATVKKKKPKKYRRQQKKTVTNKTVALFSKKKKLKTPPASAQPFSFQSSENPTKDAGPANENPFSATQTRVNTVKPVKIR